MADLRLVEVVPWAPHPSAAPQCAREGVALVTAANGTRTCVGGWQLVYEGLTQGGAYAVRVPVQAEGLAHVRDSLQCTAHWGPTGAADPRGTGPWEYLLLTRGADGALAFERALAVPPDATGLTLRFTFRWATAGRALWGQPQIAPTTVDAKPTPRICVVTGNARARGGPWTVARNHAFYLRLAEGACREQPDLILLPEVCLQWQVPGWRPGLALPCPGPETEPFAALAREHGLYLGLGLFERDGDAVFNTLALFDPRGVVVGKYRKVHLAVLGESDSGIRPGDDFPVWDTDLGRIGANICMDTSAAESSRLVGLGGADYLLLPIMGDHRADRWTIGPPIFNEGRWLAIQRTHAMDAQLTMVIARNEAQGSCVIDRKGEILAYNEGDRDYVVADVNPDDGYRTYDDGCFCGVNWVQRRPHLYGAFTDELNYGGL
ncbi:MAG: carbon-nitrogen hydrolase family protein [Chloroflexota bacterium]